MRATAAQAQVRQPPESFSDYAIRSIRQDLIEGRLMPGHRISAEELAESLGISHVPVREALRFLEAQGHFERGARGHLHVTDVTPEEADEIYRLRELLESEMHRVAIPLLTEDDFDALRGHFNDMERAVGAHDIPEFAQSNRAFHFVAFHRSRRTWSIRFLEMVWDAAARYQTSLFQRDGWEVRLQSQHSSLLAAMARRDVDEVNRLMNEHRHVTVESTHLAAGRGDEDGAAQ